MAQIGALSFGPNKRILMKITCSKNAEIFHVTREKFHIFHNFIV